MTPTEKIRVVKKLQNTYTLLQLLFSLKMGLWNDLVPLDAEFQVELEGTKKSISQKCLKDCNSDGKSVLRLKASVCHNYFQHIFVF